MAVATKVYTAHTRNFVVDPHFSLQIGLPRRSTPAL